MLFMKHTGLSSVAFSLPDAESQMVFSGIRVEGPNCGLLGLGDLRNGGFRVTIWVEVPFERIESELESLSAWGGGKRY